MSHFDHQLQYDAAMALRLPSIRNTPIGFAHRGARAHARENTAEAFDLAAKLGATGLHTDVWLSADNELLLHASGHVGLRRRHISSCARADLPDDILTLPEFFARIPDLLDVSLAVRDDACIVPLFDWAASVDPVTRSRLYISHSDWQLLKEWRASDGHVHLVNMTAVADMAEGPERRAANLADAGIDAVTLRHNEWTGGMATLFHRFERLCFGWDAQHRRILDDLLRMGLDGLYSDHVDTMMDAIGERPEAPRAGPTI